MKAIRFASVWVRQAPGFTSDYRPALENLGEGFNLVLAPNAAGKSTLARAMRSLIWPKSESGKETDIEATVDTGEGPIQVRVGGGVSFGESFSPSCAPAPYHDFRLSDLLQPEGRTEQEMAASIEQVWKGYDRAAMAKWFDGRAESLRLLGGASVRLVSNVQADYRTAYERREAVRLAAKEQNHLDARLAEEQAMLDALVPADELAIEGAMLAAYLQQRDRVSETVAQLRGFEPRTVLFTPSDLSRRKRLASDLEAAEIGVRDQIARVEGLRRERGERPGRVLTREEKEELKDRVAEVRIADLGLEKASEELRIEEARVASSVASAGQLGLPPGFDPIAAARNLGQGLGDLEKRAEVWAKTEAQATAFEELKAIRPTPSAAVPHREEAPETPNPEWRERILAAWAAERPPEAKGDPGLYLLVGAVTIGVVAAFLPEVARIVMAILAAIVAVVGFVQARGRTATPAPKLDIEELRNALKAENEGWRAFAAARAKIDADAETARRQAEEHIKAKAWWEGVERKYKPEVDSAAKAPQERQTLAAELGLPDRVPDLTLTLAYRLVASLSTAESDLARKRAAYAGAHERFQRVWDHAVETVCRLGGEPGRDSNDLQREANGLFDLSNREENLQSAERELKVEEGRSQALLAELGALHTDRGLELDDIETFELLAEAAEVRRQALVALRDRREAHRKEFRRLVKADAFARIRGEGFFDMAGLRRTVVANASEVAERRDEIERRQTQVREYEATLAQARRTNNQEMADAGLGLARENLARTRETTAEAAAGAELLGWLDETVRRTELPEVLRAANDLLDRAVPGLTLGAEGGRLVAHEGGKRKEMGQLSDGTRVQAILAARLGFLKHQEEGLIRAPLFLDETLANSDVQRAESVMRMVLELCREGRQIFYFSNQAGEAARWRDVAFSLDPELFRHHTLDVPGRPRLRISDEPGDPEYLAGLPHPQVGFAAYLEGLTLSPCDPWGDNLNDLPLAWLCAPDELEHLHQATQNRRETLGRLLARSGAYDPAWVAKVKARAAYLEELQRTRTPVRGVGPRIRSGRRRSRRSPPPPADDEDRWLGTRHQRGLPRLARLSIAHGQAPFSGIGRRAGSKSRPPPSRTRRTSGRRRFGKAVRLARLEGMTNHLVSTPLYGLFLPSTEQNL
ncbi:hypothetical protein EON81_02345 [bacterium]|nr:MAG: hypothetical protein EON81_02345 [bacterium]